MTRSAPARLVLPALLALVAIPAPLGTADAASGYGCFKVTTPSLNIRARPYRDSQVVGTASAGDIVVKRKRWCTLRGYWCAIRKGTLDGYADKSFLEKTACP